MLVSLTQELVLDQNTTDLMPSMNSLVQIYMSIYTHIKNWCVGDGPFRWAYMCWPLMMMMDRKIYDGYFQGLRPLAGYASLKLCHVHVFCMRNVSRAMIWLVRLCMLPTPIRDDAGP